MSDETTVAAAEAPTVVAEPVEAQPEAPAAETPPAAPPTPARSRGDARRNAQARAKEVAAKAEAAHHAQTQAREPEGKPEGGQFTAGDESAEAELAPPVAVDAPTEPKPVAADAPAGASDEGEAADAPTPGIVKIPLSEDHPYRARGITEWEAPAARESEVRGMLNAVAERATLKRELEAARESQALLEARVKAQTGELPAQRTPEIEFLLGEIEGKYSPETRALFEKGLDALNNEHVSAAEREARDEIAYRQTVETFVGDVRKEAHSRLAVWQQAGELDFRVSALLDQYGEVVDSRNAVLKQQGKPPMQPSAQEFYQWIAPTYAQDPRVQQSMRARSDAERKAAEERVRAEERQRAAQAEREKLEEAATRHGTRPPSTSSYKTSGSAIPPEATEAREKAMRSHGSRRTAIRRSLKERYGG